MIAMASQNTRIYIVWSTVASGAAAGNSPVTGEFPHKRPVTRKMFPFDDVIMARNSYQMRHAFMKTSCHEIAFRTTGPLWRETIGNSRIPLFDVSFL